MMEARTGRFVIGVVIAGLLGGAGWCEAVDFEREVAPIFREHCVKCHGPEKQKGGLRLDQRLSLLRGGDGGFPSLVPGNAEKSHLLERLKSEDADERMPQRAEALSAAEIATIEKWVVEGAPDVVTTAAIMRYAWHNAVVGDNSLHQVIRRLRKALNDTGENDLIRTVWAAGYALECPNSA